MSETNTPIRVLHVLGKIGLNNGISSVVMNYYNKLDHNKLTFDFMLNEDVEADVRAYIESNGSKIYIMPELKASNTFKYIKKLRDFYKTTDYKIIHGHVANSAVFYLGLAWNIPHRIIHSHNTQLADIWWKHIRNWILTRFIKFVANKYITCSKEAAEYLFGRNIKALILNNAIDIDKFIFNAEKREKIRKNLGVVDKVVIGHAGRFCVQKNHEFLLDVFYEAHEANPNLALMLLGDGELREKIEQKAKMLGIDNSVLFLGTKDNVYDYMNAMDMFVLPSLFEGLAVVGIEAQASGLRMISSSNVSRDIDITKTVEFLSPEKTVWIQAILDNKCMNRLEIGMKVKQSGFNIETQIYRLCEYYEELLSLKS